MIAGLVVLVVASLVFAVGVGSGLVRVGRESARRSVAADPETARGRLAEVIAENGNLAAEMKNLRREWADFEKSWERRWGTLTRAQRRDSAAEAAAAVETATGEPDPTQLEFSVPGQVPMAEAARPRLRPMRLGRVG